MLSDLTQLCKQNLFRWSRLSHRSSLNIITSCTEMGLHQLAIKAPRQHSFIISWVSQVDTLKVHLFDPAIPCLQLYLREKPVYSNIHVFRSSPHVTFKWETVGPLGKVALTHPPWIPVMQKNVDLQRTTKDTHMAYWHEDSCLNMRCAPHSDPLDGSLFPYASVWLATERTPGEHTPPPSAMK